MLVIVVLWNIWCKRYERI